ncbi:hypothetical protein LRS13_00215 [Svornostia abyssi]|uniref:Tetratricopeptide repeat protein n=1 Tax=Svornostia abyssi TaxID=2898438 RepID=A0ABY5PH30_9ACTN|nr:hypothetical protein LRS13_00215 [Parviterribacteraceae bacterium J379]
MSTTAVIARAHADLDAGRAWKARDRLQGALANAPHDQAVLALLGDVAWAMNDLPAAGAAWWLTDRTGQDVDAACSALSERAGHNPGQLLRMIKPQPPVTEYPDAVVERVRGLVGDTHPRDRHRWLFEDRPPRQPAGNPEDWGDRLRDHVAGLAIVTVVFGPWFVGVAALAAGALWLVGVLR